jgi:transposase InsO family protein
MRFREIIIENMVLRKELEILKRSRPAMLKTTHQDRTVLAALNSIIRKKPPLISLFRPETILKWQKERIKAFWNFGNKRPKTGRPPTPGKIRKLILRMKTENMTWGSPRIADELSVKLGIKIDQSTVHRILRPFERGWPSADRKLTWTQFLKSQIGSIFAMDFMTVDTITNKRLYVLFIIRHKTREIVQFGITEFPGMNFVRQQLIRFEEDIVEKTNGIIHLVHDNDAIFRFCLEDYGITPIKTAPYSPKMNSIMERFIGSIRREALDNFLLFNSRQTYNIIREYVDYYNSQRPHQGIEGVPKGFRTVRKGRIRSKPILSGLHHHYFRTKQEAA